MSVKQLKWFIGAVAVALIAVACSSGSSSSDSGEDSSAQADPNGTIKVSNTDIPGTTFALDPARSNNIFDSTHMLLIYGAPLKQTGAQSFEPWLAESVEAVDSSTVHVKLRSGITFSDGAPYDAAAFKQNLERNIAGSGPGTGQATFNQAIAQLASTTIDSPLEFTLHLKTPVAGAFFEILAGRESVAVSPKALANPSIDINKAPVGAGPFLVSEYTPGQSLKLRKNPSYSAPQQWKLAGIDFVGIAASAPKLPALLSGAVDVVPQLTNNADVDVVKGNPEYSVQQLKPDSLFQFFNFCADRPPFDDVRVRQAIQHSIDRDEVVQRALQGYGEAAYATWRPDSPNYNADTEQIAAYDPDEARSLLAQAGKSNLTFDLGTLPQYAAVSEVLKAQFAKVGMNANIVSTLDPVGDFYVNHKFLTAPYPNNRPGVQRLLRPLAPDSIANPCRTPHPVVMADAAEIMALPPDDPQVSQYYQDADQNIADNAFIVPFVWFDYNAAVHSSTIGGELTLVGQVPQFDDLYVKA